MSARVGQLDQRLIIQTPTFASSTQSSQGVASFSTLATVWAAIKALGGNEGLQGPSITSIQQYEIEIRGRSDVTPRMRAQWTPYGGSAKTVEILAVVPHSRTADRLVLTCGETP